MTIPGIGKDLHWWHALTGVAATSLLACIAQGWPNGAAIAAGFCGIGLGEWTNHAKQQRINGPYIITGFPRNNSPIGIAFDLAGLATVAAGIIRSLL